jgi:23S rRNA pseudouridine1911/1915/1917 synthase
MLHAETIEFEHPTTGENVYFESELPQEFTSVLAKWDTYTASRDTFTDDEE